MDESGNEFEVFVSYARRDNAPATEGGDGWVTLLIEKLQQQFAADGAAGPLRVFFDKNSIREGYGWQEEIYSKLLKSKYFLAVLSPNYFVSDWCRREWEQWTRQEIHRHCLRDGAAPIYFVTVDGFPSSRPVEEIAHRIVELNLRRDDPSANNAPAIARAISQFGLRKPYDLRQFDANALSAMAEASLKEKLARLSAQARDILGREEAARKSPTEVPDYNPAFTGRVQDLIDLRTDLAKGATGITAVVHGLGGIGKTELALAYAHAYAHEYPGGRYVVPCAGVVDWRGALDRFADLRGWTFEDKVKLDPALHLARLISRLHEFAAERGRCLLVCDNVDSAELLRSGKIAELRVRDERFHLLLTTRLPAPPDAGAIATLHWHALDSLPIDEAVVLLETIVHACPERERPSLAELAKELGGFTIAVELTGKYLVNNPADAPGALLARLRAATLPELGDEAARTGRDLFRHGEEARLDFIVGETLATLPPIEIRALEYAAQLAPDAIPLRWMQELLVADFREVGRGTVGDPTPRWTEARKRLSSLRLLVPRTESDGRSVGASGGRSERARLASMHRLIQEIVRARFASGIEQRRRAVHRIITTVCASLRENRHERSERWLFPVIEATVDALLSRAERGEIALAHDASFVANDAWGILDHLAAWSRAEPLLRRALALIERHIGSESTEWAATAGNLAVLLKLTNRLSEAEALQGRALAIDEKIHGRDHPSVATRAHNLASLLYTANRLPEAEALMRRDVDIKEKSKDPELGTALNNLAELLRDTNRLSEAETMLRRALAFDEKTRGPNHPFVARDLNNLGSLVEAIGRSSEAQEMYRRALAIDEAVHESGHPDIAIRLSNLAGTLSSASEKERIYRQVLGMNEKSFGVNHPIVAGALNNLALLLQSANRFAEAEPMLRRALEIDEAAYGESHPDVARDLNNLAELLRAMNRLSEARPIQKRAVESMLTAMRTTGHAHPDLGAVMNNYAVLLNAMGVSRAEILATLRRMAPEIELR